MSGATLVINDHEKFCENIWQYKVKWTEEKWKEVIENFAENLQDAYHYLDQDRGDDTFPDNQLYIVGDIINMLCSIDVKLKEE